MSNETHLKNTNDGLTLMQIHSLKEDPRNHEGLLQLNALRQKFEEDGLFHVSRVWVCSEILICLALHLLCFFYYRQYTALSVMLDTIVCIHVVWWIHDAGHEAYFKTQKIAQFAAESMGIIFLGMPQLEYHFDIHRRHHRKTNLLKQDPALDTGPVTWHPAQRKYESKLIAMLRPVLWLGVILPFTWPILTVQCTWILMKRKSWLRLLIIALRWALFVVLFKEKLLLLIIPPLVTGFVLGLSASLNHFHMPIWQTEKPWLSRVFMSTQNIQPQSRFLGWLMGGLNCHVEHHLFPNMPSRHLHKASISVEQLAQRLRLPYHANGLLPSFNLLLKKLNEKNSLASNRENKNA
ncbi:MAG: fatty acid desaturase [Pseudomonadota bacterium]